MSDGPDPERLNALEAKLKAARTASEPGGAAHEDHYSGARQGWQMVSELVVGLLMGFGIGYGVDRYFDTLPVFLVIFTMLGFAGGVRAMMHSAAEIAEKNAEALAASRAKKD